MRRVVDFVRPKYGHMALKRATEENLSIIAKVVVDRVVVLDIKVEEESKMRCWGEIDEEPVLVWSLAPARHVHLYKTPGLISFPFSKPVRARWAPIQTETVRPITRHQLPSVRPRASLHPATRKHLTCSYFSPWPMSPYPTTPLTYLAPALIRSTLLVKTALPSSLGRPVAQGSMSPRVSLVRNAHSTAQNN